MPTVQLTMLAHGAPPQGLYGAAVGLLCSTQWLQSRRVLAHFAPRGFLGAEGPKEEQGLFLSQLVARCLRGVA